MTAHNNRMAAAKEDQDRQSLVRKTKFSAYFWSKKSATNVILPLYTWELEEQSRAALVELLIKQTRYMVKDVFINYGYLLGRGSGEG